MPLNLKARAVAALPPFAAGAASVFGFAPFEFFPLAWLSAGFLFWWLGRVGSARAALAAGFAWGFGAFITGVSWVLVSMNVFGGLPMPLAALATALFCAYLALFPALVGAGFVRLRRGNFWFDALLFASLWALAEALRGGLFTGFPWLALGYSQTPPSPLAGFAPLFGVYGVSFVTAWLSACLAEALVRWRSGQACAASGHPPWARGVALAAIAAAVVALGGVLTTTAWTAPAGAPVKVALLQGNVAQDLKWRPERFAESLLGYFELTRDHPAQLTVLPETALPAFFDRLPAEYVREMESLMRGRGGDLLIGSVVGDAERYTNSVVTLGVSPRQRYDKQHLVPFGEYVPPGFGWFIDLMQIPLSGFAAGGPVQKPFALAGQQLAMNICYEDLFGAEIRRGLPAATVLVNLSNTAWFGRSWAQPQHLQIAQMRALETGRPMLRATNTGMTAHVTPDGRVAAVLPPFVRDALVVDVQGMRGETPFVRFGYAPILLFAALLVLAALAGRLRGSPRTA